MRNYQPTYEVKETAQNIRFFVEANKQTMWKIYAQLLPYILIFYLLDAVITGLYFSGENEEFSLGAIIAGYFNFALIISWHRVVIHGPDNFKPMNPFKPTRSELGFIGMMFAIAIGVFIAVFAIVGGLFFFSPVIAGFAAFACVIGAVYLGYKMSFYFPAKAVNMPITLRQSYSLTRGYLWRILFASFRASVKYILQLFGYFILMIAVLMGIIIVLKLENMLTITMLGFILSLPIYAYFQPILTVVGVTALSNYYMHAMQNRNDSVTNP